MCVCVCVLEFPRVAINRDAEDVMCKTSRSSYSDYQDVYSLVVTNVDKINLITFVFL